MNCEEAKDWIAVSVFGRLTAEERERLNTHLGECPECASAFERTAGWSGLLHREKSVPLPDKERSWRIIRARALRRTGGRMVSFMFPRPALGFTFALLFLVVGFTCGILFRPGGLEREELARLRREVSQIREITAAALVRQESLGMGRVPLGSLPARSDESPMGALWRVLAGERDVEFIGPGSGRTSPIVEWALMLVRQIEGSPAHSLGMKTSPGR